MTVYPYLHADFSRALMDQLDAINAVKGKGKVTGLQRDHASDSGIAFRSIPITHHCRARVRSIVYHVTRDARGVYRVKALGLSRVIHTEGINL